MVSQSDKQLDMHPISINEAYHLLNHRKNDYISQNIQIKEEFAKTLEYTEDFMKIENLDSVYEITNFLKGLNFKNDEISIITSIYPQTISEVKILIPSTIRLDDALIQAALNKIQEYIL